MEINKITTHLIDKNGDPDHVATDPILSGSVKRWRSVAKAVFFIVCLPRKALPENTTQIPLLPVQHSPSYVSLEIPDDDNDDHSTIIVLQELNRITRDKDLVSLSLFDRTKRLAQTVANHQQVIVGSNIVYPKMIHRMKGLFSLLFESFTETTVIIQFAVVFLSICSDIVVHDGLKEGWWFNDPSMLLAVLIAVLLSFISKFMQNRRLEKLMMFASNPGNDDHHGQQDVDTTVLRSLSHNLRHHKMPLQSRFKKLTTQLALIGLGFSFLAFVLLLIGHFRHPPKNNKTPRTTTIEVTINAFVNVIVVAVPEALPLAIELSLDSSMKKLIASKHALVRKLSAYETMGSITSICTNKSGILTLNQMEVVEFWQGKEAVDLHDKHLNLVTNFHELFRQDVNSTQKVLGLEMDDEGQKQSFIETINSEKKRSGAPAKEDNNNNKQVHWKLKGAAKMIPPMCSTYYDRKGMVRTMDDGDKKDFEKTIQNMTTKGLWCVAFAHKLQHDDVDDDQTKLDDDQSGLTLLGLVGLKDPCQPGVREAIESCKLAGVDVKVVTTDSLHMSKIFGVECGILKPDDESHKEAVMEGVEFRNYLQEERLEKIDRIRILARSSSSDKLLFVQCLKQKGHKVAVTAGSDGAISIDDALRKADVGLSLGTKIAKESSDIVILDDKFASIVSLIRSSRCFCNNIQKFTQFQLTTSISAIVISVVAAASVGNVPLTAVQLLWVNFIMDTLAALALATEQPTEDDLMKKPPVAESEPLITKVMWRNLIAQALYQISVLLILQFKGKSIFGKDDKVKQTMIFNCFVLCQVFNKFNARKIEKRNIFEGIVENKLFMGIVGVTLLLQVAMVEFFTYRLNWVQWSVCIAPAAFTWPIGWLVKRIPV